MRVVSWPWVLDTSVFFGNFCCSMWCPIVLLPLPHVKNKIFNFLGQQHCLFLAYSSLNECYRLTKARDCFIWQKHVLACYWEWYKRICMLLCLLRNFDTSFGKCIVCYDLSAIGIVGQYFWTSQLDFMGFLCIFFLDSHVVTATITWVVLAVNSIGLVLW